MLVLRSAMTFLFFVMLECNACAQYEATNGMLQCGFSNFVYEVKLTETKKLSHGVCLFCSIKDESDCGKTNLSETTYEVDDVPYLNDVCYGILLKRFVDKIVELEGGLPSIMCVKSMMDDVCKNDICIDCNKKFLSMNGHDVDGVKNLVFQKIVLDEDFYYHFAKIIEGEFDRIKFIDCKLDEGVTFSNILDSCNVVNLEIINCGITEADASELLMRINPYCIKSINFSNNNFSKSIVEALKNVICGRIVLDDIDLGNETLNGIIKPIIGCR